EAEGSSIARAANGSEVTLYGQVRSVRERRPRRNLLITEAVLADDTGTITAAWFNHRYVSGTIEPGTRLAVSGVVDTFAGKRQIRVRQSRHLGADENPNASQEVTAIHSQVGPLK